MVDGRVSLTGLHLGDERPSVADVIENYNTVFQSEASTGVIVGAGLCLNVRLSGQNPERNGDAIRVDLESETGDSISVFEPYRKGLSAIDYGDVFTNVKPKVVQRHRVMVEAAKASALLPLPHPSKP